jgi:multicomponent Na+:H+ antiporter subunit D
MTTIYSFFSLMTLLIAAFIVPLISLKRERFIPHIAIAASFIALIFATRTAFDIMEHGIITQQMEDWAAPFGITLVVDGFSALLIFMIAFIGFLVTFFSLRFIRKKRTKYYALLMLLQVGLLGIAHTGDMFNLFVSLEIVSISSYVLASYYRNASAIEGAIKYLIIGSFGTSMLLLGVAFLYGITGTLNMADLAVKISTISSPILPLALGMIITGLGIKAAIFPFHAWKPDVVSVMPASAGAIFSALSTSIGIYAIMRIVFTVFSGSTAILYYVLIAIGAVTMILGALLAMQQKHLLRLLAYSAISQVGYIMIAFGVGGFNPLGFQAGVFHLFNVAMFETLLFLCSGVIYHKTGTYDMERLGGLARYSPAIAFAFLIGMLANVGVPLFNGFASKWLIYIATLETFPVLTVLAVLASIMTLMYGLRAYSLVFLGNHDMKPGKVIRSMLVPVIILAAICLLFGVLPQLGFNMAGFVAQAFDNSQYINIVLGGMSGGV